MNFEIHSPLTGMGGPSQSDHPCGGDVNDNNDFIILILVLHDKSCMHGNAVVPL